MKSAQIRNYFWFGFSCIQTEYGDLQSKFPYSVRIQENTEQKKLRIWTLFTQCEPFYLKSIFTLQDGETTLHLTVRYLTVAIALEIIDEMKRVMDQEEFVKAINTRNRVHVAYTAQKNEVFHEDFLQ